MINKIHPELLKEVNTLSNIKINCFLHAKNYESTLKQLDNEGVPYKPFPFMQSFYVSAKKAEILRLSKSEDVSFITKEASVSTLLDKAKSFLGTSNLPNKCGTIAFIDTGINPHLDFLLPFNRIIHFKDFINNRTTPYDDNGHGTFIAGVASGSGIASGYKYSGISPASNIIMLKALDKNGETSSQTILEAMQYIYDIRKMYNIKVVCMSFGAEYSGTNDPLQKGALALWNSGIVVVAAAGNSGPDKNSIKSPGTSSRIITVGGLDDGRNDNIIKIADFSSRGPVEARFKPDLVAPSVDITSTNYDFKSGFYTTLSGTSVATPIIAGICSRLRAHNPTYSPDKIKHILLNSCLPLTHNKNDEGYGYPKF